RRARPSRCEISKLNTLNSTRAPENSSRMSFRRSAPALKLFREEFSAPGRIKRVRRLRVGVIYGGRSGEHEVSLASAAAVFANLDRDRYEPIAIRIEKDGRWTLADRPPTALSAADVIEQARLEGARAVRPSREVHLLARPSTDTLLAIDRKDEDASKAVLTGLGLDLVFPVLHGPYGEDGTIQ